MTWQNKNNKTSNSWLSQVVKRP